MSSLQENQRRKSRVQMSTLNKLRYRLIGFETRSREGGSRISANEQIKQCEYGRQGRQDGITGGRSRRMQRECNTKHTRTNREKGKKT